MTVQHITRIGIIGLGLIGTSIAKLIQEKQPECHIKGYDINSDTQQLLDNGTIQTYCQSINTLTENVDLVIVATPIEDVLKTLDLVTQYASPDTIITDVASVKLPITSHLKGSNYSHCIIPGHPMGGSDQTGFSSARFLSS